MIIFYNKKTGIIIGTVKGRKHSDHIKEKVWIGDKKEIGRKVVEWKRTGKERKREYTEKIRKVVGKDKSGNELSQEFIVKKEKTVRDYEPDCDQKEIMTDIELGKKRIFDYKIKNGKLIK